MGVFSNLASLLHATTMEKKSLIKTMRGGIDVLKKSLICLSVIFYNSYFVSALTTKTWTGSTNNNFNTASNWSPSGVPSSSDSCVINATSDKTISLSGNITVGALYLYANGNNVNLYVDCVSYLITIEGNLHMKASGNSNTDLYFDLGSSSGGVSIGRHAYIDDGGAQQSFIVSDVSSPGYFKLYGNLILGAHGRTLATYEPYIVIDGTSSQTITINNTDTYFLGENVVIGSVNNPTVTLSGSGLTAGFGCYDGNFTINGSSILNIGSFTIDRIASSGGTLAMNSTASLKIGGTADFPSSYSTYTLNSTSNTYYYGTTQSVTALTYGNLYLQTSGTKTVSGSTVVNGEMATSGTCTLDANAAIDYNGNVTIGSGTTYLGGATTATIAGNWTNNGTFTKETSTFNFDGSAMQYIEGTSATTFNNMTVSNSSGVTITQGPTVAGILTFSSGNIYAATSTEPITIETTGSCTGQADTKCVVGYCAKNTNSTSKFTFPVGSSLYYRSIAVTPSGTGATNWLAKYFLSSYSDLSVLDITSVTEQEYWTLDRSGASPVNASIELSWAPISAITDISNILVAHYNGSDWHTAGVNNITGNTSNGTVTSDANWSSYSPFTLGFSGIPLPTELVFFNAVSKNSTIELNWETASEFNMDYYEVEASFDGIHFHPVGVADAIGNSTTLSRYEIADDNYVNGINYYRLKQYDMSGNFHYSPIVSVDMTKNQSQFVKTINTMGQEVDKNFIGVVFDVYADGTMIKKMQ